MQSLIRLIVKYPRALKFGSKLSGFVFRKSIHVSRQLALACDECFAVFVDAEGVSHELYKGLRDVLKPDWQKMFGAKGAVKPLPAAEAAARLRKYRLRVESLTKYLDRFDLPLKGRKILEVGAGDGATAYALAECGPAQVVASDIPYYYLPQESDGRVPDDAIAQKNHQLECKRASYRPVYRKPAVNTEISFVEDDMTCSNLLPDSFDYIFSWEVLEHFSKPRQAFLEMARVLRPGGYMFHEYNPFFSLIGGHSLCTLDFPWGHARLSADDFNRYITEFRPAELEVAKSFYHESLNRMCLADLKEYIHSAGLEIVERLTFVSETDNSLLDKNVIDEARRFYPKVTSQDFVCPKIWLLLRKR